VDKTLYLIFRTSKTKSYILIAGIALLDLFRRGHRRGKKTLFFPLFAFFRSNSWAILPKKAFKWKENSTFFPLR
jgi:hypothetical protein